MWASTVWWFLVPPLFCWKHWCQVETGIGQKAFWNPDSVTLMFRLWTSDFGVHLFCQELHSPGKCLSVHGIVCVTATGQDCFLLPPPPLPPQHVFVTWAGRAHMRSCWKMHGPPFNGSQSGSGPAGLWTQILPCWRLQQLVCSSDSAGEHGNTGTSVLKLWRSVEHQGREFGTAKIGGVELRWSASFSIGRFIRNKVVFVFSHLANSVYGLQALRTLFVCWPIRRRNSLRSGRGIT